MTNNSARKLFAAGQKPGERILILLVFAGLISGCMLSKRRAEPQDLTNSRWIYTDEDWTYEVRFLERGKLFVTHPNDKTKDNDSWQQVNDTVYLYYNDKYATYTGQLRQDTIIGLGKNQDESWKFKMIRK